MVAAGVVAAGVGRMWAPPAQRSAPRNLAPATVCRPAGVVSTNGGKCRRAHCSSGTATVADADDPGPGVGAGPMARAWREHHVSAGPVALTVVNDLTGQHEVTLLRRMMINCGPHRTRLEVNEPASGEAGGWQSPAHDPRRHHLGRDIVDMNRLDKGIVRGICHRSTMARHRRGERESRMPPLGTMLPQWNDRPAAIASWP